MKTKKSLLSIILIYLYLLLIVTLKGECFYYSYTKTCMSSDVTKTCILEGNNICVEKELCDRMDINDPIRCEEATTTNPKNFMCIFNETSNLCEAEEICNEYLSYDECYGSTTLNPEITTCVYKDSSCVAKFICNEKLPKQYCNKDAFTSDSSAYICNFNENKNICEIRNLCNNLLNEGECLEALTPDPLYAKCVYDNINGVCKVINLCDKVDNNITDLEECNLAVTSDPSSSICVFNTRNKKCEAKKLCDKIDIKSKEDCNSGITSNPEKTKCFYNDDTNQCEIKKICNSNFNKKNCLEGISPDPLTTKCYYDKTCEIRELCEFISSPEKFSDCENQETSSPEKTKCVLSKDRTKCEVKTLCEQVISPSKVNCESATTNSPSNSTCIYSENGKEKKCETKVLTFEELCLEENYPSEKNCELIINTKQKSKKCIFDIEKNKCIISELCLSISSENSSKKICKSATPSKKSLFCEYDFEQKKCVEKEMCLNTEKPSEINCKRATTLDERSICIFDSKNKTCAIQNLTCEEIKIGASKEVCESIIDTIGDFGCIYDENLDQCIKSRKCTRMREPSKINCERAPTLENTIKKCIFVEEDIKCKQVPKLCNEITYGATKEICENAKTAEEGYTCVVNSEENICEEIKMNIAKKNSPQSLESAYSEKFKISFIYLFVYGFFFIFN